MFSKAKAATFRLQPPSSSASSVTVFEQGAPLVAAARGNLPVGLSEVQGGAGYAAPLQTFDGTTHWLSQAPQQPMKRAVRPWDDEAASEGSGTTQGAQQNKRLDRGGEWGGGY